MSIKGEQDLRLEARRREQLRLNQVRSRAQSLAARCRQQISEIADSNVQQLVGSAVTTSLAELDRLEPTIMKTPDIALRDMERLQRDVQQAIGEARTKAGQWTEAQAKARQRIDSVRTHLGSAQETVRDDTHDEIVALRSRLQVAQKQTDLGEFDQALTTCDETEAAVTRCLQADLKERERREIVRGLVSTLTEMGFVIDGLAKRRDGHETVHLVGKLPSGRCAEFEIALSGRLSFDLDGYEGNTCVKDIDQLEATMRSRFAVRFGKREATLTNPIRISKDARDLPPSATRKA